LAGSWAKVGGGGFRGMDCNRALIFFFTPIRLYNQATREKSPILSFFQTAMATTTTHPAVVSPLQAVQNRLSNYRDECLKKGTYLAAPTEELVWYTVNATKASYLIRAADAPQSSEEVDPANRPPPAELVMILKGFFIVFIATYHAEVSSRFLRTIGSSALKQTGYTKTTKLLLSKRPSSLSSGRHPHTWNSLMTSNKRASISLT